jgi:SAM-dependent methyltransferase
MLRYLYDRMPPAVRAAAKAMLAASGHKASFLDPVRAKHLAKNQKRYGVVAPKLERRLALADVSSLVALRCMEFGCGLLPTELAHFWTIGAKDLVAVDYNRIAHFEYMRLALGDAAPGFKSELIDYRAPFDMSKSFIPGFDFIHSESVLEHVAPGEVAAILTNLLKCLVPGGVMIHSIDLRDHRDPENAPFAFLDPNSSYDPCTDYDARGNRLREADWRREFGRLHGLQTTFHKEMSTLGRPMPSVDGTFVITVSRKCRAEG